MRLRRATAVIGGLLSISCVTSAHANQTIGSNLSAAPGAGQDVSTYIVANEAFPMGHAAPGGTVAPSSGVITRWAIRTGAPSAAGNAVTLRVIGGQTAIATGHTYPAPSAAGVHTYYERMPITAGQTIALQASTTGGGPISINAYADPVAGALSRQWTQPFPDGETKPPIGSGVINVLFQATFEPDADADGFGDETQDGCTGQSGSQAGCPPPADTPDTPEPDPPITPDPVTPAAAPETQIDSGPAAKITKPKATFTFSSPSSGSTFECALDDLGFSPCVSPATFKRLRIGKHRLRVRAISADGLLDASPAEQAFKVKRKKPKPK